MKKNKELNSERQKRKVKKLQKALTLPFLSKPNHYFCSELFRKLLPFFPDLISASFLGDDFNKRLAYIFLASSSLSLS